MGPDTEYRTSLESMFDLAGRTAFVAGGYGGLGAAIAWGLASRGAVVTVAGRDGAKAETLAARLNDAGLKGHGAELDATDVGAIGTGIDAIADRMGSIDILVNCVGINVEQMMTDVTEEAFDQVYTANLKSSMFLAQAVARRQIETGRGGKHIHMLSVSSHRGFFGRGYSAYCSTKGALIMLVRQHALELAPHDIQVNGVAPTYVRTDMIARKLADPELNAQLTASIPAGRIAEPEDVAGPAVFLASPAAGFVTGQVVYVDGGISANR